MGAQSLPPPSRPANADAAVEVVDHSAKMTDQLCLLSENQRDELVVISAAAASPTRRQRCERSHIATAKLAPQPLHAAHAGHLPPQVSNCMLKTVTSPASDRLP